MSKRFLFLIALAAFCGALSAQQVFTVVLSTSDETYYPLKTAHDFLFISKQDAKVVR